MVNPIATVTTSIFNSLRGPALKPEQPAAAQKKPQAPQALPAKPASTAPNQATFTPIQITTATPANPVAIPESAVETIASEFAPEVIPKKTKHSQSNLKDIYNKIYNFDHKYNQSEGLTLTQNEWTVIQQQLNINKLAPNEEGINGHRYLGLTKKELIRLANFNATTPKEGDVRIGHDIVKILKHAIREVNDVSTLQDNLKKATLITAEAFGTVASLFLPLAEIIPYILKAAFSINALLRNTIQTGIIGGLGWIGNKIENTINKVTQPLKDVANAISNKSSTLQSQENESEA
jgi:hypothetical protein